MQVVYIKYVSGSEKTDLIVHDRKLCNSRHECTIIIHRASFIIQHVSYMNALLNFKNAFSYQAQW